MAARLTSESFRTGRVSIGELDASAFRTWELHSAMSPVVVPPSEPSEKLVTVVVDTLAASQVRALEQQVATLQDWVDEAMELLEETLANLEMAVVDGYFVKIWPDAESGEWVAHCPTVRVVAQAEDRDSVVEAIASNMSEMLNVLEEMDAERPGKDLA